MTARLAARRLDSRLIPSDLGDIFRDNGLNRRGAIQIPLLKRLKVMG